MKSTTARVAVFNGKGGVGKSTVSQVLAIAWETLLIDADPQSSSFEWGESRADGQVIALDNPNQAIKFLDDLNQSVVIDTPGFLSAGIKKLLTTCSLVVVPTSSRENDLKAIGKTIGQLYKLGLNDRCIILPARVHPRLNKEFISELLSELGVPICPYQLSERSIFDKAQITGKVAAEIEPDGQAAIESKLVAEWIKDYVQRI